MNKTIPIVLLSALPLFAMAADEYDMHGAHDTGSMSQATHGAEVGRPGDPGKVSRTVDVTMDDAMRFSPSEIQVKAGETIRFLLRNKGKVTHEMVIGSMGELKEHAEMMRRMPDMQHAQSNMITLAGGQIGGLVWQFDQPGAIDFACLVPGHMAAGMVGKVEVQ